MLSARDSDAASLRSIVARMESQYQLTIDMLRSIRSHWALMMPGVEDGTSRSPTVPGHVSTGFGGSNHVMSVFVLGKFQAFIDGAPVSAWRSQKAQVLFKFLVSRHGQRVTKEALMETLWPEGDASASANSLRVAVHSLRQTLAAVSGDDRRDAFLVCDASGYCWNPDVDCWVDADEFARRWREGRRLEAGGDYEASIAEFEAADGLYRGDFMEDDPFEEWTIVQREALKDSALSILRKLALRAMANGNYDDCISHCQQILAHDPSREDVYRLLMESHAKLGQFGRARRWFEICEKALRRDLDANPAIETRDLYRQLLGA